MLFAVEDLPAAPLAASATFHARELPRLLAALAQDPDSVTIVFPPADHTHRGWRLSAVQSLARASAPQRINAIASDDVAAIAAAAGWLASADGVTGQYWPLDGHGAGEVLPSAP